MSVPNDALLQVFRQRHQATVFHVKQSEGPDTDLAAGTRARLQIHVDLLIRWNQRINLISAGDVSTVWPRHVKDSLQLLKFLPAFRGTAIDLGSGAGFPGLVLAIASEWTFHLVEADARKAVFLREAARETGASVIVHNSRIETAHLNPAAIVTARALAPLDTLLRWSVPLLAQDGFCLFPKGRNCDDELTLAARQWHMRIERAVSRTDPAGTILKISEVRHVGPHYRP